MKTQINLIKITLLAGLFFTTLLLRSNNGTTTTVGLTAETEKTIRAYFKFPQILMPHMETKSEAKKIEVLFSTGKNGKVNFVLAKTTDQVLKHEIEKQFSNMRLEKLKQDVVHSVVLSFRTL